MNSISGLPASIKDSHLEVTILQILEKKDVKVHLKMSRIVIGWNQIVLIKRPL